MWSHLYHFHSVTPVTVARGAHWSLASHYWCQVSDHWGWHRTFLLLSNIVWSLGKHNILDSKPLEMIIYVNDATAWCQFVHLQNNIENMKKSGRKVKMHYHYHCDQDTADVDGWSSVEIAPRLRMRSVWWAEMLSLRGPGSDWQVRGIELRVAQTLSASRRWGLYRGLRLICITLGVVTLSGDFRRVWGAYSLF